MLKRFSAFLYKHATTRNLVIAFALNTLFGAVIMPYCKSQIDPFGYVQVLDLMITGYSAADAYMVFDVIGAAGRKYYIFTASVVDTVYPITYMFFYSLLLCVLLRLATKEGSALRILCLLPFLAAIFDYFENIGIVIMLSNYPTRLETLATITSVFSMLKWATVAAFAIVALGSLIGWGLKAIRKK